MEKRTCEWCAEELPSTKRRSARFCAGRCADAARQFRERKCGPERNTHCKACGAEFPPTQRPHAQYCNRKCKAAASQVRRGKPTPEENAARYLREKDRRKKYAVAYYWDDAERGRESTREWRKANPEKRQVQHQRRRATKRVGSTIPFTTEQWQQKKAYWGNKCYLQIPGLCTGGADTMDHVKPLNTLSPNAHMLANVRPACRACNCSKNSKWPYAVPAGPKIGGPVDAFRAGTIARLRPDVAQDGRR